MIEISCDRCKAKNREIIRYEASSKDSNGVLRFLDLCEKCDDEVKGRIKD